MVKSLMHWLRPRRTNSNQISTSSSPHHNHNNSPTRNNDKNNDNRLLKYTDIDDDRVGSINPFILTGYRKRVGFLGCLKSLFVLHNETVNIWSHLIGFLFFAGMFINDVVLVIPAVQDGMQVTKTDFAVICLCLICYQATMVLSSLYHTFECHSSVEVSRACFALDILGITLGLMATYLSGIYYAFWCEPEWRDFYLCTVGGIFLLATSTHFAPAEYVNSAKFHQTRTALFTCWAIYGIVPTVHWAVMQGFDNPVVNMIVPRIFIMYLLCGVAMFFYVTKMPERLLPGWVDIIGHSHQWWHIVIFIALIFWHQTGLTFALFRLKHGCANPEAITDQDVQEMSLKFWS